MELSKNETERLDRLKNVRKRKIKSLLKWLLVLAILAAAVYGLVAWSRYAESHKPGVAITQLSRDHIAAGSPRPEYNSNPPTSGPHYDTPAAWGFYDKGQPVSDEQLVHNLEHGGIWISYKNPDDAELKTQIQNLVDRYSVKLIATARPQNEAAISVAAWGRLLNLEQWDKDQVQKFINAFINKGPEQVPY